MRRLIAALAAAAALLPLAARADGEAGLVIQVGDQVTTYCVPFTGDSISGERLLAASGLPIEQFGGSSGKVICAIGPVGCFNPSSFDSCFCQCKGSDCTYWAFFTRAYGKGWVYSSVGISLARAKDGEVHGWKWGRGGTSSAPAPADITFDQICGHPPRGGAAPTPLPPTPTPSMQPSPIAPTAAPASPGGSTSPGPADTPAASPEAPGATMTLAPSPAATAAVTLVPQSPAAPGSTVAAPATGGAASDDGNPAVRLAAFAILAGALLAAIGGAAAWRARRGR